VKGWVAAHCIDVRSILIVEKLFFQPLKAIFIRLEIFRCLPFLYVGGSGCWGVNVCAGVCVPCHESHDIR
jgi:hypothetical protein